LPDMNAFLSDVKRAALEAVRADKPFGFLYGEVTGVSPLKVRVDQKLELAASQLILTNAVRDHAVKMTVDDPVERRIVAHQVHLSLKVGERVLLLRADGGRKFIVLDRVEEPA